ncbi:MAG: orotate phosphoribosyltransferase [Campylobacterota bacterium]
MDLNVEQIYKDSDALLEGHFVLSSGNHSAKYLQSAKVLEDPKRAQLLCEALAKLIQQSKIKIDTVCAPALGGLLAGYELARALDVRFIFVERKEGQMQLRRGFEVARDENIVVCEDIITTGGSAMEAASIMEQNGANVVAFAALANRGFCVKQGDDAQPKSECKLPQNTPLFALENFEFQMYDPTDCPLCKKGSQAIKPGSRSS